MPERTNQYLGRLLAAWTHMSQDGQPPAYDELRPEALRFILPDVCLIDVRDDGSFGFRLVGTGIVDRLRNDPTGEPLNVLGPQTAAATAELFAATVSKATPMAATGRLEIGGRDRLLDALCLPLADEDGSISVLLVGIEFRSWSQVEVEPPLGDMQIWEVEADASATVGSAIPAPMRRSQAYC
ncbi:MAG: PAS domain-containing protein [Alphaproteobacteria bacterium]